MAELSALNVMINGDSGDLTAAVDRAENSLRGLGTQATRTNSQIAAGAARVNQYATQVRSAGAHTANLGAQFNDIGVMLAAGQSPLMLAVQQGTQINQVLQQVGTTGRERLGALAAAFTSLISPANLATFGIIAGGAALVQWGIAALGAESEAVKFSDQLDALNELMTEADRVTDILQMSIFELRNVYGEAAERVRDFAIAQAELTAAQASRRLAEQLELANYELRDYIQVSGTAFRSGTMLSTALTNLSRDFGITSGQARALEQQFRNLSNASTFDDQQASLVEIVRLLQEYEVDLSAIPPELARAISEMITLSNETDRAANAMSRLRGEAAGVTIGVGLNPDDPNLLPPPRRTTGGGGGGGGGGGISLQDQIERDLEQLREGFMTREELEIEAYASQQELLQQALEQRLLTQQAYNALMEEAQAAHQDKMAAIDAYKYGTGLQVAEQFMGDMAKALQGGNEKMARISKAFAASEALINAWRAYSQVIADPSLPFFAKIPAALSVLSAGIGAVNAIKGISGGGGGGGATGGGAASIGASAAPALPRQNIVIDLVGDTFSRGSVQELFNQLNDGLRSGYQIEGVLVR
jgi:hypothetical protein